MEQSRVVTKETQNEQEIKLKKRVENALTKIHNEIPNLFHEKNFKTYLEYLASNIHFDFYNSILLYIQPVIVQQQQIKDRATNVAGYITWQKRNKSLKSLPTGLLVLRPYKSIKNVVVDKIDEHGEYDYDPDGNIKQILIEKPCLEYTAGTVFDISQTNQEESLLNETVIKTEVNVSHFISAIREVLSEYGFILRFDHPARNEKLKILNSYSLMNKHLIIVSNDLSLNDKVWCVLYETAKVLIHQNLQELELQEDEYASALHVLSESIAYVISSYYSLKIAKMNFHNIYEWSIMKGNSTRLEIYLRNIHSISNNLINKLNKVIKNQYSNTVDSNDEITLLPSSIDFNYLETSILIACFPPLEENVYNPEGQLMLDAKGNPIKRKIDVKKICFLKKYELVNTIRDIILYSNDSTIHEGCNSLLSKLDLLSDDELRKIEKDYIAGNIISTEKYTVTH